MPTRQQPKRNRSLFGGIMPILILMVVFFVGYSIISGIISLITFFAIPIFLVTIILALVWDKSVIAKYFKDLGKRFSTNPLMAILQSAFTVVGFPVVSSYLAFKAFMKKRIKEFTGQTDEPKTKSDGYTDYEEVEEQDEDFLELEPHEEPEVIKQTKSSGNEYEDLFD